MFNSKWKAQRQFKRHGGKYTVSLWGYFLEELGRNLNPSRLTVPTERQKVLSLYKEKFPSMPVHHPTPPRHLPFPQCHGSWPAAYWPGIQQCLLALQLLPAHAEPSWTWQSSCWLAPPCTIETWHEINNTSRAKAIVYKGQRRRPTTMLISHPAPIQAVFLLPDIVQGKQTMMPGLALHLNEGLWFVLILTNNDLQSSKVCSWLTGCGLLKQSVISIWT